MDISGDGIGLKEAEMVGFRIIFSDFMELISGFEDVHVNGKRLIKIFT
jgi:hypothetical protein